jgi:hypothetical protein
VDDESEHVAAPEQYASAGRGDMSGEFAGDQPSLYCPDMDAAQLSDLSSRQKLIVVVVFGRHGFLMLAGRTFQVLCHGHRSCARSAS